MKSLHQGERLLLLANRSGKSRKEIAQILQIHPGHLSKLLKSEILTSKIKNRASDLFGVPVSFFDEIDDMDLIMREPEIEYKAMMVEGMALSDVVRYWEEKDRRHYEERARLLAIIENLTRPSK